MSEPLFPVFLKLGGRKALLVGAGRVASAKLPALLAAGAEVTVVAPVISPAIAAAPVAVYRRPFVPTDLDGAWIAVAAATPEINREVAAAARPSASSSTRWTTPPTAARTREACCAAAG